MSFTRTVFAVSACFWLAMGTAEAEFVGLNIDGYRAQPALSDSAGSFDLVDDLDVDSPEPTSLILTAAITHTHHEDRRANFSGFVSSPPGLLELVEQHPLFRVSARRSGLPHRFFLPRSNPRSPRHPQNLADRAS